ncbi:MAG: SPFH domain-containing protein [Rhodopila sp.]
MSGPLKNRRIRESGLPLAALLVSLTGIAGAWLLGWARRRGDSRLVARMARWPQALVMVPLCILVILAALLPRFASVQDAVVPETAWFWGGTLIVLAFPLLVAERVLAAWPPARLPEAPGLRALLFLATIMLPATGALEIAAGLGAPSLAARLMAALSLLPCAIAAELALRAIGRCFLPPPPAAEARAVESILARMLAEGTRARSLAEPLRQHLGIDFARSWALAYVRAAFAPLLLALLLLGWALSGVALVPLDQRMVYERFGAPVRVLHPGLHLVLPWPLGRLRPVEFGTVHQVGLAGDAVPDRTGAEEPPPRSADRLWERTHPNEMQFLIAAARADRQSFHLVNTDIRLFYRIGLSDDDALKATYRVADPPALLRQAAGRVMAAFFAGRTLNAVLGENREAMADHLRALLLQDLDAAGTGLDLTAVVIDAIHPPGGAADAYHAVQAAQINAEARITAERGLAHATFAEARQNAAALETDAAATAAELTGTATADATRFIADRDAAGTARDVFLFERRLARLIALIPKTDAIIMDHRISAADAPLFDLRPPPGDPADAVIGKP